MAKLMPLTGTATVVEAPAAMVAVTGWVPDRLPSFQLIAFTVVGVSDGLSSSTFSSPAAGLVPVMTGVACSGVAPEVTVAGPTAPSV